MHILWTIFSISRSRAVIESKETTMCVYVCVHGNEGDVAL